MVLTKKEDKMKKRIALQLLVLLSLALVFSACGGYFINGKSKGDVSVIKLAYNPISGHVFHAIAEEKGFYDGLGIRVETVEAIATSDAFQALAANQVNLASTYGTAAPLQRVADGQDVKIVGGYMITGGVPIFARAGTEWNGVEDIIGKKFVGNKASYTITGPLMDMGYDVDKDIEWIDIGGFVDKLEAVRSGVGDYCTGTTGLGPVGEKMGLKIVAYCSDVLPDYSCCRVSVNGIWFDENQETMKKLFIAWLRAQEYFENNREEVVDIMLRQVDSTREQIEAFILDDLHYKLNLEPNKRSVVRAWDYMDRLGLFKEGVTLDRLEKQFDFTVYKAALDECVKNHYNDNPSFYDRQLRMHEEDNVGTVYSYLNDLRK